jgi:peptidyl-prolyl cis-trans isomerase C
MQSRFKPITVLVAGILAAALLSTMPTSTKAQTSSRSAAPAQAAPVAQAIAQVNGKAITLAAFEQALQDQLRAGNPDSPALREAIRRDLVIQAVLAQEAEKDRLDRTPELEQRLAAARSALLAQAWQQQWLNANPPTDAEVQAEYDQIKARTGNKEYQIRQVVLRDDTAAKLVMDQIKAGKSLADMAKEYSIEPLGKEDGGLLPWVTAGALVAPLGDVVTKASVGQLHPEVVRTTNGFHIIQVVAERPFTLPPLAELRGQMLQNIAQRKLSAAVQEQVNAAKIELR